MLQENKLTHNRFYTPIMEPKKQKRKSDIIDRELFIIEKIRRFEFITQRFIMEEFTELFRLKKSTLNATLKDMEKRGILKTQNMKLINNGVAKFYFLAV